MITKHIDLPDALTHLPEERIEEALLLDSAEALSQAKHSEKVLRARDSRQTLKRWLPVPLCAVLCLAVILPLSLGLFRNRPENPTQIDNPWVYVETVKEVCDALHVRLPDLPRSKTVKSCALLADEMGDILFTDGSRLSLRLLHTDLLDESEMDLLGGVYGAALTEKEQRGSVTVYHFQTSDSRFTAWVYDGVYYWYEPTSSADREQMIALLLPITK